MNELLEARDEKRLLRLQKQLATQDLLIVDELGYVPLSKTGAELLFEIFSQRRGGPRNSDRLLRWDPDHREGVWNVPKETELPG